MDDRRQQIETEHGQDRAPLDWERRILSQFQDLLQL